MRIGILVTGHVNEALEATYGDYPSMFMHLLDGRGFTFVSHDVVDMEFPASVHDADGWLITGSKHGAYEDLPFIAPLEAFIRDAYAQGVPLVGICFGHQVMAQALGGRVEKYHGGWAVGAKNYHYGGRILRLNAWHQDQVVAPPPEAAVIASNPFCKFAGLAYGDRAWSVQPHPEIGDAYLQGLLDVRGPGIVPDDELQIARDRLGVPLDDQVMADEIAAFFRRPRAAQPKAAAHG